MNLLNFGVDSEKENVYIDERRVLINDIYKHYVSLEGNDLDNRAEIEEMINDMEGLLDVNPVS